MKKIFICSAMILVCNILQARFFIGIDTSYRIANSIVTGLSKAQQALLYDTDGSGKPNYQDFAVGFLLGTEHAFGENNTFGARWFFAINSKINMQKKDTDHLEFQLGADFLTHTIQKENFSFGFFGGMFGVANFFLNQIYVPGLDQGIRVIDNDLIRKKNDYYSFLGRLGITYTLGKHNRFDFSIAMPIFRITTKLLNQAFLHNTRLQFTIGYKILF